MSFAGSHVVSAFIAFVALFASLSTVVSGQSASAPLVYVLRNGMSGCEPLPLFSGPGYPKDIGSVQAARIREGVVARLVERSKDKYSQEWYKLVLEDGKEAWLPSSAPRLQIGGPDPRVILTVTTAGGRSTSGYLTRRSRTEGRTTDDDCAMVITDDAVRVQETEFGVIDIPWREVRLVELKENAGTIRTAAGRTYTFVTPFGVLKTSRKVEVGFQQYADRAVSVDVWLVATDLEIRLGELKNARLERLVQTGEPKSSVPALGTAPEGAGITTPKQGMNSTRVAAAQSLANSDQRAFLAGFTVGDSLAVLTVRRPVGAYKVALMGSALTDLKVPTSVRDNALATFALLGKVSGLGNLDGGMEAILRIVQLLEPALEKAHDKNVGALPRLGALTAICDHFARSAELANESRQTEASKGLAAAMKRTADGLVKQASAVRLPSNVGIRLAALRTLSGSVSFAPDVLARWRNELGGLMTAYGVRPLTTFELQGDRVRTKHVPAWDAESERLQNVINDLESKEEKVRKAAETELTKMGRRAVPSLLAALTKYQGSGESFIPVSAYLGISTVLAQIGEPALEILMLIAENWEDSLTRSTAVLALGLMGNAKASPAVNKACNESHDEMVRTACSMALSTVAK